MKEVQQAKSFFTGKIFTIAAILFSGLCWYLSNGLSGNFWYLLWLAPIPVLIISFKITARLAFVISFVAYLIGRLSWFYYLVSVLSIVPAIIFTLVLPLVFALIVLVTRKMVIKTRAWYAVFAFPVFFTTFEFLVIQFSPDGSAGSIAYSQSDFLPVIQIASVTGILGITFLVTLVPSAIAIGWYLRKQKIKLTYVAAVAVIIVGTALIFGMASVRSGSAKPAIKAGLVVLDEKFHNTSNHPDFSKENVVTENYAEQVSTLATRGADVIVFPERAINMNKQTDTAIINILTNAAKQNHVFIITGYTNFRTDQERNSALIIDAGGNVVADYGKVHFIKGLEAQFTPGSGPGLFNLNGVKAGTAICKDLDYPGYIKKYGENEVSVLLVPAWDFVMDDWLHSRMAILRGVESGFSEVRAARLGRLTISDCYGRVTAEASSSNSKSVTLFGEVSLQNKHTFYTRFGDWFGILNLIVVVCFAFILARKKNKIDTDSAKLMIDKRFVSKNRD